MEAIDTLLAEARRRQTLPPPPLRRLLRQRAGLTQDEVADALGIGRTAVTRWESGAREPRRAVRLAYIELLERLAEVDGND
jgi:transcriptional regulator with XRE-family HTH domain